MARLRTARFDERLTLVEHLDELRTRIIVCVAVLVVAIGLCFWQNHLLLDVINAPLPAGKKPITLSPTEPFLTTFKISAYAGIIIAFLILVPFLFIAGVVFGYFVVLPAAIKFLLNFNSDQFRVQVRASEYYGFAT